MIVVVIQNVSPCQDGIVVSVSVSHAKGHGSCPCHVFTQKTIKKNRTNCLAAFR